MNIVKPIVVSVAVIGLAACAGDPNRRTKIGAGAGAVVGAVLGDAVSDARGGPIVGAVVGALAGGAVGRYMDKQQKELEQQLSEEAAKNELQIVRLPDNSLKIGIASDVSFDVNSATIKPEALATYGKIANILKTYDKTVIHVVGHTDSTGSADYNQGLSQRRASSVASYVTQGGVVTARVREEGRGLREPIADNGSPEGRTKNRRVDIVLKPVVEGDEQAAWTPPPNLGS